jgi:hypothetical protein
MSRPLGTKLTKPRADKGIPRKQFCPKGHDTFICGRELRGMCSRCKNDAVMEYQKENREQTLIIKKRHYQNHRKEILEEKRQERIADPKKAQKDGKENYERNRKKILATRKQFRKDHPEITVLWDLKNDTERALRIVKWGQKGINKIYKNKPKGLSVDHRIPLRGDEVSGLHVSWNLQYLSLPDNMSKSNKADLVEISEWYGKLLEKAGLK